MTERCARMRPGDAVRREAGLPLERHQGGDGCLPGDRVDRAAVEAALTERDLQAGDLKVGRDRARGSRQQ